MRDGGALVRSAVSPMAQLFLIHKKGVAMRWGCVFVLGLSLFFTCIHLHAVGQDKDKKKIEAKKKANVYTDPADAPIDCKIQGEYASDDHKLAAQVVARGNGKFDVYILQGGLPGAGWDPKSKKVKIEANFDKDKDVVEFSGSGYNKGSRIDVARQNLVLATDDPVHISLARVERKSPTLGATPPKDAVILFDGRNADEWKEGKMSGDLLGVPNTTKRTFTNFKLHIEFRTPFQPTAGGQGRGNSGVYVCGKEVQVLDSFGLKGANNECGAIYGERAPNVNMCFPPLVWQTFDMEHRAGKIDPDTKKQAPPRITVRHNGILVHEGFELKGGANQGNIHLQNHGNPVVYRNVWVVELR
jgi:hypothetical protein